MKPHFLIVSTLSFLFSCHTTTKNDALDEKSTLVSESASATDTLSGDRDMDSISKDVSPAAKAIAFISIGNLDVMTKDLGFFDSKQADIACRKLGDGWRLPNEEELTMIYEQNDKLGSFKTNYYLGMGNEPDAYNENGEVNLFLRLSIISGEVVLLQSDQELYANYGVRAVRSNSAN